MSGQLTTQKQLADKFGISKTALGKNLTKIAEILSNIGVDTVLKTNDGLVTEFGVKQVTLYRDMGIDNYRAYVSNSLAVKADSIGDVVDQCMTDIVPSTALTVFDNTEIALHDSTISEVNDTQTHKLSNLYDVQVRAIDNAISTYVETNESFFNAYLTSGIEIGKALGAKKAALQIQTMQQTEHLVMNEFVKKQLQSLG